MPVGLLGSVLLLSSSPITAEMAVLQFPVNLRTLLFLAFALLVVHLCQRLVEQTALAVEHYERRAAFARTAVAIGSLVWALDAGGLLLYPELTGRDARLAPTLLALVAMIAAARWTVPALTTTRKPLLIAAAAAGLACGMLLAHGLLISGYGHWSGRVRWPFAALSLLIATVLATALSLRHRAERLRSMVARFRPLAWPEKLLAAAIVMLLHWCLVNVLPLQASSLIAQTAGWPLLLALVLAVSSIAAYQLLSLRVDSMRQRLQNRALSLLRTASPSAQDCFEQRLALIAERLPVLLGPTHLNLHYQPLVPQRAMVVNTRFEALLRIRDPELGSLPPELFLLACERAGLSQHVDRAILQRALQDAEAWRNAAVSCAGVSVNITPDTLLAADFVPWLTEVLVQRQVPAGWLQLEITEHALMSASAELCTVLRALEQLSVPVVMDDFGTGFSSLGVLIDLPMKGIKCDRSFVRDLASDLSRQVLLHHLCAMAHDLQLSVTIEGIETEAALAIVHSKGADIVQGYVYAKPMPPELVPVWLHERCRQLANAPALCVPD